MEVCRSPNQRIMIVVSQVYKKTLCFLILISLTSIVPCSDATTAVSPIVLPEATFAAHQTSTRRLPRNMPKLYHPVVLVWKTGILGSDLLIGTSHLCQVHFYPY